MVLVGAEEARSQGGADWSIGPRWAKVELETGRPKEDPNTKVSKGLKGANGGGAKEQDSFGTGGRRRRLGGTIIDKGDLELDESISNEGDLELEGTSCDRRLWGIIFSNPSINSIGAWHSSPSTAGVWVGLVISH